MSGTAAVAHMKVMKNMPRESGYDSAKPFDLSTLTSSLRVISPHEHGIGGLGALGVYRFGTLVRIVMTHPDGVKVNDLITLTAGGRDVDVSAEAEAVLSSFLGADANSGGAPDSVEIAYGRIIYTQHQNLGAAAAIDPRDLAVWAEDFIAVTDPEVQRGLIIQVEERYERN